jgi:hypothetical protein
LLRARHDQHAHTHSKMYRNTPASKRSDRAMLQSLLDSGKLSQEEAQQARKLCDDLVEGRIARLNPQHRAWVDHLFFEYKLGGQRPREAAKISKARKAEIIEAFDAMPRPKKPPGRT